MLRIEMLTIFYPPCSKRRWCIAAGTLSAEAFGRRLIVWKTPTAAGTFGGDPALQDHQRLKVRREATTQLLCRRGLFAAPKRVRRNKIVSASVGSGEELWLQQKVTITLKSITGHKRHL